MAVNLQQATVPATALLTVVMAGMGWWVNAQEKDAEAMREAQSEMRSKQANLTTENELLRQLVTQQAQLVKQAAEDAKANRETLIRIEAKLERPE